MASPNVEHARHERGLMSAASEQVHSLDLDELEAQYQVVLDGLRGAFRAGKSHSTEWRKEQARQMRRAVVENADAIEAALKADLGRPAMEVALAEVATLVGECDHVIENVEEWAATEKVWHPMMVQPGSSEIKYEPKGVVLVLAPWNYPVQLSLMGVLGAISAGNCVLLKPSEVAPASAALLERLITEYLDAECVKVVQGAVPETTALLRLRWDHILYTGNGAVGRIVAKAAARHLTPTTLELGGKSPAYVDKSASLKVAARRLLAGKFLNCGQTCVAPDHALVHESVLDAFLKELKSTMVEFFGEDPATSNSFGRVVNQRHFDRIMRLIDPASHGGEIVAGGPEKAVREDKYMPPTLVLQPRADSPLMQEEIFGPVLPILSVKNAQDAVDFITSREHPLALYVFSEDSAVTDRVVTGTCSGGVCVNDTIMHLATSFLPFGGVGDSGQGAYHGVHGFKEFSHSRAVMHRSTWLDPSLRYPPYSEAETNALRKFAATEPMNPRTKKVLLGLSAGVLGMAVLSRL